MTGCLLVAALLAVNASENNGPLIPPDAKLEKVWGEGEFTEGPAYGWGGCVYFSDIGDRIMKYDPATGKTTEYRNPSGRANGLDFDPEGRLVACEGASTGSKRASPAPTRTARLKCWPTAGSTRNSTVPTT